MTHIQQEINRIKRQVSYGLSVKDKNTYDALNKLYSIYLKCWINDNRAKIMECQDIVKNKGRLNEEQCNMMYFYYDNHWCGTCAGHKDEYRTTSY